MVTGRLRSPACRWDKCFPPARLELFRASSAEGSACPPELNGLIGRLLAKDPAQRPQSAVEVAGELRAMANRMERSAGRAPVAAGPRGSGDYRAPDGWRGILDVPRHGTAEMGA